MRIAAWTETSSALVGSSATTIRGSPANARAIASRCLRPPDSWRGLRSRWRWVRRRSAASLSTRSLTALPLSPVSLLTERDRMWRAVQPRLSAESGFWKTIWRARLSSVGRLARLGRQGVLIELDGASRVRALDAEDRPGQGRLARARLADEPEGLAVA